jgi:hypothetical protein
MSISGNERILVYKFTYKKVYVEIYKGMVGASCADCKLDHDPDKKRCDNCSKPLAPAEGYFVCILGTEIMTLDTQKEAVEWAKTFIDSSIDRLQADLYEAMAPEHEDEPDEPEDEDVGRRAVEGREDLSPLEKQIVKLGWVRKANAILARMQAA